MAEETGQTTQSPEVVLGIDLGTTFSCVAYVDAKGDMNLIQIDGQNALPSVVRIADGAVEVGQQAMNQWIIDSKHVIRWVKRSMGDPSFLHADTRLFGLPDDWLNSAKVIRQSQEAHKLNVVEMPAAVKSAFAGAGIDLPADSTLYEVLAGISHNLVMEAGTGGYCIQKDLVTNAWSVYQGWSAVAISAEILKELKRHAEAKLGRAVNTAMITCPAWFNSNEVEATKKAGIRAGFVVKEVVKEPVAAGVYHAMGKLSPGQRLLVCDLGGGTFDATIIEIDANGAFRPAQTNGDRQLGGHDWTEELKKWMQVEYQKAYKEDLAGDLQTDQDSYEKAEEAKKGLATISKYRCLLRGKATSGQLTIEREMFENLTSGHMRRVIERVKAVLAEAHEAYAITPQAQQKPWELHEVLLVGGSSRLRAYAPAIAEVTGIQPVVAADPDLIVAYGAAALAAGRFRPKSASAQAPAGGVYRPILFRTVPRSMGTRAFSRQRGKIITVELLPKGTKTAAEARDDKFKAGKGSYMDIPVVEFENAESDTPEHIRSYRCVLDRNVAQGDAIEVCFKYDISGIISVGARHVKTSRQLPVENHPYIEPAGQPGGERTRLFALDVSYSMAGELITSAKQALEKAVRTVLARPGERAGVVTFGSDASVLYAPGQDVEALVAKIGPVTCDGSTNMSGALAHCRNLLEREPGDREIILLTDGMPDSPEETLQQARTITDSGIRLSILPIGTAVDEQFLKKMTERIWAADGAGGIGAALTGLLEWDAN